MRYSITAIFFITMVMLIGRANSESYANQSNLNQDWSEATLLADAGISPKLTTDGQGQLLLAYINQNDGQANPYYRVSTDNGIEWSEPAPIFVSSNNALRSVQIDVTYHDNVGHAVWVEDESKILYSRENNWATNGAISLSEPDDDLIILDKPAIIGNGPGRLDVIWAEGVGGNPSIYHKFSLDSGQTWPDVHKNVVAATSPSSTSPAFVADHNGELYVVWSERDRPGGLSSIWYAEGTVAGTTVSWSTAVRISDTSLRDATSPYVLLYNGVVNVFFTYREADDQQYLNRITCANNCTVGSSSWNQQGNPISNLMEVNTQDPFNMASTAVVQQGCLYTSFHGISTSFNPDNELIWSMSNCTSWTQQLVTVTNERSLFPTLAAEGQWLYLAYETGQSSAERQIAFRRTRVETRLYLPITLKN
jgi:hypothetical protein